MNIDFSLVLVNLVLLSGAIWLLDLLFLKPRRDTVVSSFEAAANESGKKNEEALDRLSKEPIIVEYAKSFFPVFFVVLIVRSFAAEPFTIPSESMLPTLEVGDYILVSKYSYGFRLPVIGTKIKAMDDPQRGDVLVFKFPQNPKINYIKRVVGVPGDIIKYENKRLFVNGEKVAETAVDESLQSSYAQVRIYKEDLLGSQHYIQKRDGSRYMESKEFPVPEGHYFVMGDNRDNSNDSRFWGTVDDKYVVGKALFIWMNKQSGFHLPSFSRNTAIQ